MTVSSTTSKVSYTGNGSTTAFAVTFYFLEAADLQVILRSGTTETVQVLTTNYTVAGAGNEAGGTVTMLVAPAAAVTITIRRNIAATQETDLLPNDRLPAESLETALDKVTMLTQQLGEESARSLKYPASDAVMSAQLPASSVRAGKYLGFDASGLPVVADGPATPYSASDVSYLASGSGATLRSVSSKLRELAVTPEDFGAVGDNVTDDLTAVQAAFNSGFPVFLSNQYYISSTATLPQNTTVFGAGPQSMIRSSGALPVLTLIGTSGNHKFDLILRDFTVKRSNGNYSQQRQFVEYKFADDCVIDGVTFDGDIATSTYAGSFAGIGVDSLRIENCQFINGAGCLLTSSDATTSGVWSNNCIVKNCYKAPAAVQGFDFYYARNLIVDGCIAHGQTSAFGCGFVVEFECENVTLTNCIAYDNTRSGFYLEGNVAYGVKNVTLNNCIGHSNGESGITLDANYLDIVVNGGAYTSNTGTFGPGTGHGIAAAANLAVTISGAVISDNASHGIVWVSNPYQFSISNCLIRDNGGYGIYFTGTVASGVLSGNLYFNNTSGAVFGWQESGGSYVDGPWVSWTPTWYKNDGITTIAVSAQSAAYKRVGNTVFYNAKVTFSGTPDSTTQFTIPIAGAWPNGSTADVAARPRGTAYGAATTFSGINGIYSNSWLRVLTTAAGDTTLSVQGAYEIA